MFRRQRYVLMSWLVEHECCPCHLAAVLGQRLPRSIGQRILGVGMAICLFIDTDPEGSP